MEEDGEIRGKRKFTSSGTNGERPMKQRKPQPMEQEEDDNMSVNGDTSPREPRMNGAEDGFEDDIQVHGKLAAVAETKEWQATIERVVRNVVSIVGAHGSNMVAWLILPSISARPVRLIPTQHFQAKLPASWWMPRRAISLPTDTLWVLDHSGVMPYLTTMKR